VPDANDDFALYGALDIGSGRTFTRAFKKERSDYTIWPICSQRTGMGAKELKAPSASWNGRFRRLGSQS